MAKNILPKLSAIHFSVSSNMLWVIWFAMMIFFLISLLVYNYHWDHYGTNKGFMKTISLIYALVGIGLLTLSAVFISLH